MQGAATGEAIGTAQPDGGKAPDAGKALDAGQAWDAGASLRPELLDIWYFGWSGDNASYFQIGLCKDGVASFLFAENPGDPEPERLTGRYVTSSPLQLTADFVAATQPPTRPMIDLHFVLDYDAASDRLHRITAKWDGYSNDGLRVSLLPRPEPIATCPTP